MKQILFLTLISCIAGQSQAMNNGSSKMNPDCATPSEYVLQFLKKSSTLYTGSTDWQKDLSKNDSEIHTAFAHTRITNYNGLAARLYSISHANFHTSPSLHLMEDAASGQFKVKNHNGMVEIASAITDTEVTTTDIRSQANTLCSQFQEKYPSHDQYTQCVHTTNIKRNESTQRIETTLSSNCTTKIPTLVFLQALNAQK